MEMLKNFPLGNGVTANIYLRSRDTRSGFAHDVCIPSSNFIVKVSNHYLNRTWEKFRGEDTFHKTFEKYLKVCCGLKGKKNEKEFNKRYTILKNRLDMWYNKGKIKTDMWYNKGKIKTIPSESVIFG